MRGRFAAWDFVPVPRPELVAIHNELLEEARRADAAETTLAAAGISRTAGAWLLAGQLALRLDDRAAARNALRRVERLDSVFRTLPDTMDVYVNRTPAYAVHALCAHLALNEGRASDAIAALDASVMAWLERPERLTRARALEQLGRDEEALRWYDSFDAEFLPDLPPSFAAAAPSHLARGEIHDRRGEADLARIHYARFLELWRDAEPELQPQLQRVRENLARLSAEPRTR